MKHIDNGLRCLMDHGSEDACIVCKVCFRNIRPEDMEDECLGEINKPPSIRDRVVPAPATKEAVRIGCFCPEPIEQKNSYWSLIHRNCPLHGFNIEEEDNAEAE